MRTTLNTQFSQVQSNLNRISSEINKINSQISSGRQMSKLSDNPTNLVSALGMRTTVVEIAQYQENLIHGGSLISAAENALRQIKEQVLEAKTLAIAAQTPVVAPNRHLMAPQVANLLDQAVTLANTEIAGKYIFGGYRTSGYSEAEPAPFIHDHIDGYRLNGAAPTTSAPLNAGDLKINGIGVPAALDDSSAAKAAAINNVADQTGVTAEVTPALVRATASVDDLGGSGTLNPGDLIINGVDIFNVVGATDIQPLDSDNAIIEAINAQQASTGVYASRDSSGSLVLKAVDGRNIEVETSDNGEAITHLNNATGTADTVITYGRLELLSNRTFMLESTLVDVSGVVEEPGLMALGLAGGSVVTGEPTDTAGDGKISALTIADLDGNVRYAGDRDGVLEIKVGKVERIAVSQNGQVALKNTQVFAALQDLEDALLGKNFTEVTSLNAVTDRTLYFASGATGLPAQPAIADGSFTVSVVDHDHVPPETFNAIIPVNINTDTPATIAAKLDAIPGLKAAWNVDGYLEVTSSEPDRYTFSTRDDSSNFTEAVRINNEDLQVHALNKSIGDLDLVMEELTTHISDFGARGNRIDVQSQIFTNLDLAVQENLSNKQDTDLLKAITELQAAENAYQAALASAARVMQMSLLDYL